jgi:chromosome segregation ATPase
MIIALAGLGWWSHQQIQLMQEQVVATQENFARISEDAAGRLQDISGKLVANESTGTSSREAQLLRLKTIETKLADVARQQQAAVDAQSALDKRIDQLAADFKAQQGSASELNGRLASLAEEQATIKNAQSDMQRYGGQIDSLMAQSKSLQADIAALKKQGDPSRAIDSLQQDLLVLRSELDSRSNSSGPDSVSFDAFRAQTVRNISTIQTQLQNLQQQINARR